MTKFFVLAIILLICIYGGLAVNNTSTPLPSTTHLTTSTTTPTTTTATKTSTSTTTATVSTTMPIITTTSTTSTTTTSTTSTSTTTPAAVGTNTTIPTRANTTTYKSTKTPTLVMPTTTTISSTSTTTKTPTTTTTTTTKHGKSSTPKTPPRSTVTGSSITSPSPTTKSPGGGFPMWAIGVICGVILLVLVGVLLFVIWRKRSRRRDKVAVAKNFVSPLTKIMDDQEKGGLTRLPGFQQRPTDLPNGKKNQKLVRKESASRSKKIRLVDFREKVSTMHRDSDFLFQAEFEKLDEISPQLPHDRTSLVAMHDENAGKNRFIDILPFENNHRVKINDGGTEYINASYIDGYVRAREYIATQGPLGIEEEQQGRRKATVIDFWRMVWQEKTQCIIMLTKCIEQFRVKCAQYWPNDVKGSETYGEIKVTLASEIDRNSYILRTLTVEKLDNMEAPRSVTHWYYPHWPDMKHTEEENLLDFVETVRYSGCIGAAVPTIVHCSAGVGRSGSFIALDCLLQHIRDNDFADIYGCVYSLRNQRLRMVQTLDQYILLYDCLNIKIQKKLEDANMESREDGFPHDYENVDDFSSPNNNSSSTDDAERTYEEIALDDLDLSATSSGTPEKDEKPKPDWNKPGSRFTFGVPKTKVLDNETAKSKADAVKQSREMTDRQKPRKQSFDDL